MVTPVHRFQQIDSVTSQPQSSRHIRPPPYNVCRIPETTRVEVDSSVYLESPSEPHRPPPVAKFKYGMVASCALATVFVAGAKFYCDRKGTGLEILVTCTFVVVVVYLVAGWTVCRMKSNRSNEGASSPPPSILRTERLPPPAILTPAPPLDFDAPPPPYHVAVSLPLSVTPPPSYDKTVS